MPRLTWRALQLSLLSGACLLAGTVRIKNPCGGIAIESVMGSEKLQLRGTSPLRKVIPEDVRIDQKPDRAIIRCQPKDGAVIDLHVSVPHTTGLEAVTGKGAISVKGLVRSVSLATDTGAITLAMPLEMVRLRFLSDRKPKQVTAPTVRGLEYVEGRRNGRWTFGDFAVEYRIPPNIEASRRRAGLPADPIRARWLNRRDRAFSVVLVDAHAPGRLELINSALPEDSWVRAPAQAADILEDRLKPVRAARNVMTSEPHNPPETFPTKGEHPVFAADVRLVTLPVSVYDRQGHPVSGLPKRAFEVLEDGEPQAIAFAASEELPFDLVLLLDLSGSTTPGRHTMKKSAVRFVEIARAQDRVAVYALADTMFQVVSPLTPNRQRFAELINGIPGVAGWTPLYDTIVLAYAQEALHCSDRRTALVVLTDGIDNSLGVSWAGSAVSFERLRRAAAELPVLVYPIVLPSPLTKPEIRRLAQSRMQELADATGGRLFTAESIADLRPVYARVADELRSSYVIGYYPRNQNFDGKWRRVQVRVISPPITPRTRPGYYAW